MTDQTHLPTSRQTPSGEAGTTMRSRSEPLTDAELLAVAERELVTCDGVGKQRKTAIVAELSARLASRSADAVPTSGDGGEDTDARQLRRVLDMAEVWGEDELADAIRRALATRSAAAVPTEFLARRGLEPRLFLSSPDAVPTPGEDEEPITDEELREVVRLARSGYFHKGARPWLLRMATRLSSAGASAAPVCPHGHYSPAACEPCRHAALPHQARS